MFWDTKTWKPVRTFPQLPRAVEERLDLEARERATGKKWSRGLDGPIRYDPIRCIAFDKDGAGIVTALENDAGLLRNPDDRFYAILSLLHNVANSPEFLRRVAISRPSDALESRKRAPLDFPVRSGL